jgi:uncharacterized membrane protein
MKEKAETRTYKSRDKAHRSVLKAISWRLTGTIDTFVISYIITGKFQFAISISLIEVCTKMVLYFLHERAWERIDIGREKIEDPDYMI